MANREVKKVEISKEWFMRVLNHKGFSIRDLDRGDAQIAINRNEKTIRRHLDAGMMPPDLLDSIGCYLDVHPDYLAGKQYRTVMTIDDEYTRNVLISQLKPEKFPYFMKEQENVKYKDYFKKLLLIHEISMEQFMEMPSDTRLDLQKEIERAITSVIEKYFTTDGRGREGLPDLYMMEAQMEFADKDIFEE